MQRVITISTAKKEEMVDLEDDVNKVVHESRVGEGTCLIYVQHSSAAIIVNENADPNICLDILSALKKLIPDGIWKHDSVDGNGAAHIKASILGPSELIPIREGKLQLGRWQSPMLVELDGPRKRNVIVQVNE